MFATLVLLRHAHTTSNEADPSVRMSGWTDVGLSARGIAEATAAAGSIAQQAGADAVYTSPLTRALHTAELVRRVRPMPLVVEPDLREINCGHADGLSLARVQCEFAAHWRRNLDSKDPDFRWPGGESYREFRRRVLRCLVRIAAQLQGRRALVVTHAGVITQFIGALVGVSPARWELYRTRNCSLTEFVLRGRDVQLVRYNEMVSP